MGDSYSVGCTDEGGVRNNKEELHTNLLKKRKLWMIIESANEISKNIENAFPKKQTPTLFFIR